MSINSSDLRKIQKAYEKVKDAKIPIKMYSDEDFSDQNICDLVRIMRAQLNEVEKNPQLEKEYETRGTNWQNLYDILMHLADMRPVDLTNIQ